MMQVNSCPLVVKECAPLRGLMSRTAPVWNGGRCALRIFQDFEEMKAAVRTEDCSRCR